MAAIRNELLVSETPCECENTGRSGLLISCVAMMFLFLSLATSVFLWTAYGAITACAGLLGLLTIPVAYCFVVEKSRASGSLTVARTPIERLCVVSLWCVGSFVVLMVASLQ